MRLGLYGGSFDPIHNGHLEPVVHAVEQLGLDRVLYLPTANPPHKPDRVFAPALQRFAMVELALLDDERLQVSDFELTVGPSFTIDTIEHFRGRMPEAELHLLIGADSLAEIESWRRPGDILAAAHVAVLQRPDWDREAVLGKLSPGTRERLTGDRLTWIDNPPLAISASEIRRRLGAGEDVPVHWAPPSVLKYAVKYSLYS